MKKAFAFLLILATALPLLAGCVDMPAEQETEAVIGEESTENLLLDNVPKDLKFNGEDVVILSRAMQGWTWDEVAVPELNSDPVNDAMFHRNVTVSDRLNVNIVSAPIEDPDQFKPITEIERVVKAGSSDYDLVAGACYVTIASALNGTFVDLCELEYPDLSQSYWMQDYNEMISYGTSQYTATGAIALSTYRFAFVTLFNKAVFDDKGKLRISFGTGLVCENENEKMVVNLGTAQVIGNSSANCGIAISDLGFVINPVDFKNYLASLGVMFK